MNAMKVTMLFVAGFAFASGQGCAQAEPRVLFDGTSLSNWVGPNNAPAPWKLENGYFEVVPKAKSLASAQKFGDMQLHIEWASPEKVEKDGQGRGNSGVLIMGRYEVQVLDSWSNTTYADGQASGIYGQHPPLANACRKPGEWQAYDIVFRRPKFDDAGLLVKPARMTVFHNGVLVHHDAVLIGPAMNRNYQPYRRHADAESLQLQDHGNLVRFRNVWMVPLDAENEKLPDLARFQYHSNQVDMTTNARPAGEPIARWRVNDMARPKPPILAPGASASEPASDAVVLFDGQLRSADSSLKTSAGALCGKGSLSSQKTFTNAQIHFECEGNTPVVLSFAGVMFATENGKHRYDIALTRRALFGSAEQGLQVLTVLKDGVFCQEQRQLIEPKSIRPTKLILATASEASVLRNIWVRETRAESP